MCPDRTRIPANIGLQPTLGVTGMALGILFDLDETLIDRTASITKYADVLFHDLGNAISVQRDTFISEFLRLDGNGYVAREAFFENLSACVLEPGIDVNIIATHFKENAWKQPILMASAEEVLRKLRATGFPLGIVTNGGSKNQRQKLINSGLDGLIDCAIVSEEFGAKKPDPSIFLGACKELEIDPTASWFVGDNPALDIIGAGAVGFRTVWLKRAAPWPKDVPRSYTRSARSLKEALSAICCDA